MTNYVGAGGQIHLNTYLAGDGSPSDRLVINGGLATGNTPLVATDTGGGGALTTGDGILVVDTTNGGTTSPAAFGPVLAIAGPYLYELERGNLAGTLPDNWYLRSGIPVDPNNPSGPRVPNFRPGVSLYAAIPPAAAVYGRQLIDTLHERIGEQEQLRGRTDLQGDTTFNGGWGRLREL